MRTTHLVLLLLLGACPTGAMAQLPARLPDVRVPALPRLPDVERAAEGTLRELRAVRAKRVQRLLRDHASSLDRDPRGNVVIRAQVVAIDISAAALERARTAGFRWLRSRELPELGFTITLLETPEGVRASRGLDRLRELDPDGVYDFNHVYLESGDATPEGPHEVRSSAASFPSHAAATPMRRVGLIDGGVHASHRAVRALRVHHHGCEGRRVPSAHGTAVASILAMSMGAGELYAADVYCGEPTGGAVDSIAAALGWMAREHVAVVNVSLVGPRNALLDLAIRRLLASGHVIVAAVGNDGPAAPALYPSAYPGVVGVTGLDDKSRALIEACRGDHVDFAASGIRVVAAPHDDEGFVEVRGTSFAAPFVAALLSDLSLPDAGTRGRLLEQLIGRARDLGSPGRDDVYGHGALESGAAIK